MSSHSASDSGMQKTMVMVGIALTVLTLIIVIAARLLSSGSNDEFDQLLHNAQMKRIEPVARVRTTEPVAQELAANAPSALPRSGEELANAACASCHISGAAGAPTFDDKAAWDARSAAGLEALVASVVNGKGAMPAGGASDYTEAEITRAVEFMTGLGNGGVVEQPPERAAAEADAAQTVEAGSTDTQASDSADATPAETQTKEATTTDNAESSSAGVAKGVVAALTPRIQATVDQGVCAGCHQSGVAGSPKFDDTAEWAKRAERGYAALAATVKAGKGAMPPRGGSDLSDDELLIAVEYIVQKSL